MEQSLISWLSKTPGQRQLVLDRACLASAIVDSGYSNQPNLQTNASGMVTIKEKVGADPEDDLLSLAMGLQRRADANISTSTFDLLVAQLGDIQ